VHFGRFGALGCLVRHAHGRPQAEPGEAAAALNPLAPLLGPLRTRNKVAPFRCCTSPLPLEISVGAGDRNFPSPLFLRSFSALFPLFVATMIPERAQVLLNEKTLTPEGVETTFACHLLFGTCVF